ncbi:MAG: response regulator [Anaerolineales bacterium]|nr:response regulator [Anaerolineales bacterium]MCX7609691.1 response regulator [Anaerolineales bacterium]
MAENKYKLLIVEDDLDVADMLNAYFRVQGYEVFTVNWGEDGIRACQASRPDLVILDIRLPDIDGYEVARQLRSNRRTADIPIIFLTEKRERADRLQGLELGADDYITKPFDIQELRLRVRNAVMRARQDTLTNPVTGLADGVLVDEHLTACLKRSDWVMLIVSLQNLDAFREKYGFVASDDVLRAVSLMIQNALREIGGQEDFLGHLGLTDFVVVTKPERLSALEGRLRSRLEQSLDYFYPIKDREQIAKSNKRLEIKVGVLKPNDEKLVSLDALKTALLRRR